MDRPGIALLIGALALAGCGGPSAQRRASPADSAPAEEPKDEVARKIGTGGVEILARGEDRAPAWRVEAEKSTLSLTESGAMRGALEGVSGDLFGKDDQAASRIFADRADADQRAQNLSLRQNVRVEDTTSDGKVTAETLRWLPTLKMLEARGRVLLSGRGYRFGPLTVLWASPDLNDFGSPESYKNDPNMRKLVLPLLASAAAASAGTFADDAGNMRLTFRTWRAQQVDASTIRFSVQGNPATGSWKDQAMSFRAPSIAGTAAKGSDGKYVLRQADLSSGARVEILRDEKARGRTVRRTNVLTSQSASFQGDAASGTLTLKENLVFTSALADQSQRVQVQGGSGVFNLDLRAGAEQQVKSGEISGPVTLRFTSRRGNEVTDVTATARTLAINAGGRELELRGNVIVSGSGPAIIGRMQANLVRVIRDAEGFVQEIFAEGDPGTANMREGR